MDYKDIKAPFALQGDRERIDYAQTTPEISWLGGYSYLYGLKPDETPLSPYIEREKFNEIMYLTTAKMLDIENYSQGVNDKLSNTNNTLQNTIKSLSGDCVTLKTNQSISGTKTFTGALPRSAKNPTHQDELVRMGYLSSGAAGMIISGTWHNMNENAKTNTWYSNTSKKAKLVIANSLVEDSTVPFYLKIKKENQQIITIAKALWLNGDDDTAYSVAFMLNPKESWRMESRSVYKVNFSEYY